MAPSFRNVSLLPGSGWSPPVCRSGWARTRQGQGQLCLRMQPKTTSSILSEFGLVGCGRSDSVGSPLGLDEDAGGRCSARLSGMANALRDCWVFAKISVGRRISWDEQGDTEHG